MVEKTTDLVFLWVPDHGDDSSRHAGGLCADHGKEKKTKTNKEKL